MGREGHREGGRDGGRRDGIGLPSHCGNILNGSEHGLTPSVIIITLHRTRVTYVNVVIFTRLHHHAHVTRVSVSHARSGRSERCYL